MLIVEIVCYPYILPTIFRMVHGLFSVTSLLELECGILNSTEQTLTLDCMRFSLMLVQPASCPGPCGPVMEEGHLPISHPQTWSRVIYSLAQAPGIDRLMSERVSREKHAALCKAPQLPCEPRPLPSVFLTQCVLLRSFLISQAQVLPG